MKRTKKIWIVIFAVILILGVIFWYIGKNGQGKLFSNHHSAVISINPEQGNWNVGDTIEVEIGLDTYNKTIIGLETVINYDQNLIEVQDSDSNILGIQIEQRPILSGNHFTNVDPDIGKITFGAIESSRDQGFRGSEVISKINFKVIAAGQSQIEISDQSKIVEKNSNLNILSRKNNANYSLNKVFAAKRIQVAGIDNMKESAILPSLSSGKFTALPDNILPSADLNNSKLGIETNLMQPWILWLIYLGIPLLVATLIIIYYFKKRRFYLNGKK